MEIDNQVTFYSNTSDGTHCFQAALRMVLKYFYPSEEYSWGELDKITAKPPGLWTWPMAGVIWLKGKGFKIKVIEPFDYEEFAKRGGSYLIDEYGEKVGSEQIKHSDVDQERKLAKEYVDKVDIQRTIATVDDIKNLLNEDYLVGCNLNAKKLNNQPGYVGHFVIVKGFDERNLILHDPGLPPMENRVVDFDTFEKAWAYPEAKVKNLMAFKLNTKGKNTSSTEAESHTDQTI